MQPTGDQEGRPTDKNQPPMMSVGPCLQCGKANPPGARSCVYCNTRLPLIFTEPPSSQLNLSDEQETFPLPEARYQTELMHRLGWTVNDYLEGSVGEDELNQVLDELHLTFAAFEKAGEELQRWLSAQSEQHPQDGRLSSALLAATSGLQLFRDGLDKLEEALEVDEDEAIKAAVRLICDGNDRLAHCHKLMQGQVSGEPEG